MTVGNVKERKTLVHLNRFDQVSLEGGRGDERRYRTKKRGDKMGYEK